MSYFLKICTQFDSGRAPPQTSLGELTHSTPPETDAGKGSEGKEKGGKGKAGGERKLERGERREWEGRE